jgi:STE24 endopeptidase
VGHYKKKHVLKSMVISVAQMGILFFLFGWLASNPLLAEVLGAKANSFHLSLVAFALLYAPVSLLTGLLMNIFSRKNEYEADAFARETYSAPLLITALKKLSVNHLSNLQPHPAYVFFNYSHPTLLQRIRAMI